jgi:hypothetical protein
VTGELCTKVNKSRDLCNLAYTNDKAPAPPKRDRGIADIGRLPGMAFGRNNTGFFQAIPLFKAKPGGFVQNRAR